MKNEMYNFAPRLEDILVRLRKENEDLVFAIEKLMADNNLDTMICEEQFRRMESEEDPIECELDIGGGNADMTLYHRISRSARLLSLSGQKPQEFMAEEADFLFGCPMRYEDFSDDDIDAIRFDPHVEATDDRTFYYIWIYFGEFDEIKMAAKVDSERGTAHPLPFIPVKSQYDVNGHANEGILTAEERRILIDRIFYASLIPDEITDDEEEEEIEWTEDVEDDEDDEWSGFDEEETVPDDEEEEDDEWSDFDEEETVPDDEEEDDDEWSDSDEDEIDRQLDEEIRLFDENTINITVLSVTGLQGQKNTVKDGDGLRGFTGKIFPFKVGESLSIFEPELNTLPPCEKIRTSKVMFHSEELISDDEVKHVVITMDRIYTFIEHKDQYNDDPCEGGFIL